jgi:hypothetical protein
MKALIEKPMLYKMTKGMGFIEWSSVWLMFTALIKFIDTYIFNDWQFVVTLGVIISVDTFLGLYVSFLHKNISSKGFAKMFNKVIVYTMLLICTHVATHLTANGKAIYLLTWMDSAVYAAIIVREIISVFEKCALINPGLIPLWILKRLKYFDDTGNIIKEEKPEEKPVEA